MSKPRVEPQLVQIIAREVGCQPQQVEAADELFADGATVPFVARYRKEATGSLDDGQLEVIAKRREYFLELASRRDAVLSSIAEQGKLTPELEAAIRNATAKQELEDLYLPYKPKRRTRAQIARERGLEPLADLLLGGADSPAAQPEELARAFVDAEKGVEDAEQALAGAEDILAERLSESAESRATLRRALLAEGTFESRVLPGKEEEGQVYRDYFDSREPVRRVASHRALAMLRGEREGFLVTGLGIDEETQLLRLRQSWGVRLDTPCGRRVAAATDDGYKRLLRPSIANEVRTELTTRAEGEAIAVFRANLEALLLQSPLGQLAVLGLDPGYRTGCKLAVVDATGRVSDTGVIHPIPPRADEEGARSRLLELISRHDVKAVAIGNGTGSRETELFARRSVREAGLSQVVVAIVPETGASVYSASEVARKELPELDVALRGAVSIARRLQDPLAELVKIEPRSLGVGQYQHDVDQKALARELDLAVEGVVNRVGVELNSASPSLLSRVSGLSERLAGSIVERRDREGAFCSRAELLEVAGLGPKTFEQAAGFLRIRGAVHPLDSTAVHPERYALVERMARELETDVGSLVGNPGRLARLDLTRFVDDRAGIGRATLDDIRAELERPGRDPRPELVLPRWRDEVTSIDDLSPGMVLEGRVSNVTNFGAFVDIGVKRDGLVHLSELANRWVDDPRQVVQVGQVVKVVVQSVDRERGRIGLSMKALAAQEAPARPSRPPVEKRPAPPGETPRPASLGDLMARFNTRR